MYMRIMNTNSFKLIQFIACYKPQFVAFLPKNYTPDAQSCAIALKHHVKVSLQ